LPTWRSNRLERQAPNTKSYNLSNLNILFLEGSDLISELLDTVCLKFGIPIRRLADDPNRAYDIFVSNRVDIVIADWSPGLDGIQLTEKMRREPLIPACIKFNSLKVC
jgi:DNA-binding response OmpR family regulator